jgi:Flp pilus assembly protein TadB
VIIVGFHVGFGIGPLRYSAPLTRRRRLTRKEQEAGRNLKVILFLLFVAYCIVALIVKAAIGHPAAALFIGCVVAGVVLLGVISVRERRGMNGRAASVL